MDNSRFLDNNDIPLIDEDYDSYSRYDTPVTSRIEETLFTQDIEQPSVRLRQKLLHNHIVELHRYLDVHPRNVGLVNTDLFKGEKSKSSAVELQFFNGET